MFLEDMRNQIQIPIEFQCIYRNNLFYKLLYNTPINYRRTKINFFYQNCREFIERHLNDGGIRLFPFFDQCLQFLLKSCYFVSDFLPVFLIFHL